MSRLPLALTPAARQALDRLAGDLTRVLDTRVDTRFVALVAYGPTRSVAFASRLTADDLQALAPLVDRWHAEGLETPLLLTPDEFRRSVDAFPLEYDGILDRHVVIAGTPPFGDTQVSAADLRRACEIQAKAFLIHVRQGWLEAADHVHEQQSMLVQSAGPLRALLTNVARLHESSRGTAPDTDDGLVTFGESQIGLPAGVLRGVLALEWHPDQSRQLLDAPDFMNAYLLTAETLWAHVDTWRR